MPRIISRTVSETHLNLALSTSARAVRRLWSSEYAAGSPFWREAWLSDIVRAGEKEREKREDANGR